MLSQKYVGNIDQKIFPWNLVPTWRTQHCIGYLPHKSCRLAMGHHSQVKTVQCCSSGSRQHTSKKTLCSVALMLLRQHCTVKIQCDIVIDASDISAKRKILFNVVLMPLGKHCMGKSSVKCCLRDSRQYCTGKILVQYCLNSPQTTLHRKHPYSMLSLRLQTTINRAKSSSRSSKLHLVTSYRFLFWTG